MTEIFVRTLPFFAIILLGFLAARRGFFPEEVSDCLSRFVFYFALSAMLFRFSATLPFAEVFDIRVIWAYLFGSAIVYALAICVAFVRRQDLAVAAVEAQCAVVGNVGFLGIPLFAVLFGERAIGPNMLILATDLVVFSSLIVILVNVAREGRIEPAVLRVVGMGLVRNPMIVSISAGMVWSLFSLPIPSVMESFLVTLGSAATPCALFAIGASLASRSAERLSVAGWLSFVKLVLHPAAVAVGVLWLFPLDSFTASVVVGLAALPVAGNIFMLAQHYQVAPQRVSAAILLSTLFSIVTFPVALALLV